MEFLKTTRGKILAAAGGLGALFGIAVLLSSWFYVEGGEYVRKQNPNGSFEWIVTQGPSFKFPFLSRIDRYPQFITIDLAGGKDEASSVDRDPVNVKFTDTYTGVMGTSWRYSLPADPVKLEAIYQASKTSKNLASNTLLRFSQNLITYTGNQFLGEDFMQGGQNEFLSRLYYQAHHGLYQTKRVQRLVERESSFKTAAEQEAGDKSKTSENFIWTVEIQRDEAGNPVTSAGDNILSEFGIIPEMISIVEFLPDSDLQKFMSQKKERIAARSTIVENQRNERELAITAQLKGERERIEARAEKLKIKEAAIIAEEQKVEVEKQRSLLAAVQKQKEFDIAKANEGIQKANFAASKFEAQAIKEVGLAKAKVAEARYDALNNPVYLRELEKGQAEALYRALPNMPEVRMPYIVSGGDSGSGVDGNLSSMSSLYLLNNLGINLPKDLAAKADEYKHIEGISRK